MSRNSYPGQVVIDRELSVVVVLPNERVATKFEAWCNRPEYAAYATAAGCEVLFQTEDKALFDACRDLAGRKGWRLRF
jgi:hypothetical protein